MDEATVGRFVRDDYARVVNAVAMITGDYPAAEDLVQEALARAWSRRETIESLPGWVAVVALNLSRSRWRRLVAERRAGERLAPGGEVAEPGPEHVDVARALAALPRRQREVAVLRYLLDMSTSDVANSLGVSEGTVKSSLAKARSSLAARLEVVDVEVGDVEDR